MSCVKLSRITIGIIAIVGALWPFGVHAQTDSERGGDCRARCHRLADEALHGCRSGGGDAQRCRHRAKSVFDRCVTEQCDTPSNCESRCRHASQGRLDGCLAEGGTQEECEQQATHFLVNCVLQDCRHLPMCRKRCRFEAGRLLRRCLADGGDHETCSIRARELFRACVEQCGRICGGIAGLTCEDGEFCKTPPGTCRVAEQFGGCHGIPDGCPDVWEPVCGCDHVTYANECEADAAAVSIARRGECPIACDPTTDNECPDGTFCRTPIGHCDGADVDGRLVGSCGPIPETCPDEFRPVCGCDGVTYKNPCEADHAGASVASFGECRVACTVGGAECTSMQFCRTPVGVCEDAAAGFCAPLPLTCRDVRDPVCGCDGVTYANPCEAHQAGVTVSHGGACE